MREQRFWRLALFPLLTLAACVDSAPELGPRAQLVAGTVDFGIVRQCEPVRQRFEVRNAGGLPLQLDIAGSGCGVTATPAAARVGAGDTTSVDVTIDTCALAGAVHRSVVVSTNDPTQRSLSLALSGRVDADIAVQPAQIYVGRLHRGQDAVLDAKLIVRPGLAVQPVRSDSPILEAQLRTAHDGGQRLHLRIRRDAPLGRFDATLHLESTSKQKPAVSIPVTGFVDAG